MPGSSSSTGCAGKSPVTGFYVPRSSSTPRPKRCPHMVKRLATPVPSASRPRPPSFCRGSPKPGTFSRAEEIPAVAGDVQEDGHATVGLLARRLDELDPCSGHPLDWASKSSTRRNNPTRPANWSPIASRWRSPSAWASRRPVCAPGGRTTTQRFGRPSFVVAPASPRRARTRGGRRRTRSPRRSRQRSPIRARGASTDARRARAATGDTVLATLEQPKRRLVDIPELHREADG